MAWETRNGKGSYYTQSYREGGRVRRRYIGFGETAALIAQYDKIMREQREGERDSRKYEREERQREDQAFSEYYEAVERTLRETLLSAGYHLHKGQWRKKRGMHHPEEEARGR